MPPAFTSNNWVCSGALNLSELFVDPEMSLSQNFKQKTKKKLKITLLTFGEYEKKKKSLRNNSRCLFNFSHKK